MHVYLNGFLNHVMLQEVSGVIQREVTESFLASVIQLYFGGLSSSFSQSQSCSVTVLPLAAQQLVVLQSCSKLVLAAFLRF